MSERIGYELDKLLVDPPEYWGYRIINGRRITSFGPFKSEDEARAELSFQMSLDRDDVERSRVATPREKEKVR